VQSLNDIAAALSGVPNLQATVDSQTQTLRIFAANGFGFSFAGQLPTTPDTSGFTGTATPSLGGAYTGASNDTFTFRVGGAGGIVGVTPGLTLSVENAAGNVIATLNIGEGYSPGSAVVVANGVTVQLAPGSVNAGDSFSAHVVSQPDTTGILGALGINRMFDGSQAADIRVNAELIARPELLAASRSGQPGDASNLRAMAALRDQKFLANGTQTLREAYAALVSDVGLRVQDLSERQEHQELLGQRLEAERQSVSGVDPNEELVRMVQYQRSFQMAARFINTVSETLDELVRLVR
jgi:flagellar hook-associated protein 1 FlgK